MADAGSKGSSFPWGNVITTGGALLGNIITGWQNKSAAADAFARQQDLMRLQNQYAIQNWNRENDYNLPIHQKQRLKQAGLNPDLMYGNGASGLQAGSIDAPSAPSAPMAQVPDYGSSIVQGANAALAISQAKKTDEETIAQGIRNKYIEQEVQLTLSNLQKTGELTDAQVEGVKQTVKESQANIDALRKRVSNETYDRFLDTITTASENALRKSQERLNDEQRKWVGTHAMAALIGARGAAAQANAMANAIMLFRDPKKFQEFFHDVIDTIKQELGLGKGNGNGQTNILMDFLYGVEDLLAGNWEAAIYGRKNVVGPGGTR